MHREIRDIVTEIAGSSECRVYPSAGLPTNLEYPLPADLEAYFRMCGGIDLFVNSGYGLHVVSPAEFVRANPVIRGVEGRDDISYDWFIVAKSEPAYITIDLGKERAGRCYDSFWETHALRGDTPIIAMCFTELLERLFADSGEHWYWARKDFQAYGDAYG
jgi:antitoxin YokJ